MGSFLGFGEFKQFFYEQTYIVCIDVSFQFFRYTLRNAIAEYYGKCISDFLLLLENARGRLGYLYKVTGLGLGQAEARGLVLCQSST